jgi:hypothetical protein
MTTASTLEGARAFSDQVEQISDSSRPGLSRLSTPYSRSRRKKDVDARDERGHDEREGDSTISKSALDTKQWAVDGLGESP